MPDTNHQFEPLSIMLFLHRFDEGGVEKVATRLANNWAENGHAVSLVMGRDQGLMRMICMQMCG